MDNSQNLLFFGLGVSISLIPLFIYNYSLVKNIFGPVAVANIETTGNIITIIKNKILFAYHTFSFAGISLKENLILPTFFLLFLVINIWEKIRRVEGLVIFNVFGILITSTYLLSRCFEHRFSGLFPAMPFIGYMAILIPYLKDNMKVLFLFLISILFPVSFCILCTGGPGGTLGGIQWGPRFFLLIYPFLAILSLYSIHCIERSKYSKITQNILKYAFIYLCFLSFCMQLISLNALYLHKNSILREMENIEKLKVKNIITDDMWLPSELASLYLKKNIFSVKNKDEFWELVDKFKEVGIEKFCFIASCLELGKRRNSIIYNIIKQNQSKFKIVKRTMVSYFYPYDRWKKYSEFENIVFLLPNG
jgi:hypothetical protein